MGSSGKAYIGFPSRDGGCGAAHQAPVKTKVMNTEAEAHIHRALKDR